MYERHQRVSTFLQVELYTSNKLTSAEAGAGSVLQKKKKKGSEGMQLYLKENPTQMFSCEICKLFRNSYFKDLQPTASITVTMKIVNISL